MSGALLVATGLVAGWQRPATPPLDFTLGAGEIVGLAGPNGVGKSTVLAALTGRAQVFAGALRTAAGLRIAYQPQAQPPLDGLPLTGGELLALTGARADGLPDWLQPCLDRRLDRLSGGQRHYLALWAVLATPADLLVLDEPTNHLDQAGTAHLAEVLRRQAAAGQGILLVSHDADFVAATCQRVVHLEAGHVA